MIRKKTKKMKSDWQMRTLAKDAFEEFGSVEFCLGVPPEPPTSKHATMIITGAQYN